MIISAINVNLNSRNNYPKFKKSNLLTTQQNVNNKLNYAYTQIPIYFGKKFHFNPAECRVIIPNKNIKAIKDNLKDIITPIDIPTTDGLKLKSWFIKPKENKPVFLFLNGTNSNKTHQQSIAKFFSDNGYGSLMLEYREFGDNIGTATENGLYEDAEAGLKFLNNNGFKNNKLILWGYSMGGAIATKMASKSKFKALILDSTFTNANEIKKHFIHSGIAKEDELPAHLVAKFKNKEKNQYIPFNTEEIIKNIDSPLLIMHSKGDTIIPHEMSKKLASLNENAKLLLADSNRHIDRSWTFKPIEDFVKELD